MKQRSRKASIVAALIATVLVALAILAVVVGPYVLIVPIGLLGIFRWISWLIKYALSRNHKPVDSDYTAPVSVVIPVFNEEPRVFDMCLKSIQANGPDEVITVIQEPENQSFKECVEIAEKHGAKVIVTQEMGKRAALTIGIKAAKNDIIALADSDVIWSEGLMQQNLKAFANEKIGAVMSATRALNPRKWHQKLMDLLWEIRNRIDFQLLARFGSASVVSGRTAFYRRDALFYALPGFNREKFLGLKLESGDDKYFTRNLMKTDYRVGYQHAVVYTEVPEKLSRFLKQYLRWQRNSWRSDIKLMASKTPLKRPFLALYLLDRWMGKFAAVYGTIVAAASIYTSLMLGSLVALTIFVTWWVFSRALKLTAGSGTVAWSSLYYVFWVFVGSFLSLLALATINDTGWHTRTGWQKPQVEKKAVYT